MIVRGLSAGVLTGDAALLTINQTATDSPRVDVSADLPAGTAQAAADSILNVGLAGVVVVGVIGLALVARILR